MRHLSNIQAFSAIAREGAISRAARRLNISTATASAHLDALESYLGGKLIIRSTRQLVLTELGRLYLKRIDPILESLEAANQIASEFGNEPKGMLRITVGGPFGRVRIAPLIPSFLARHPGLDVQLNIDNGFKAVLNEEYHVAIRTGFDHPSNLVQRKITTNRRVLVASPDYLANASPLKSPDDLPNHTLLLRTERRDKVGTMRFAIDGATRAVEFEGEMTSNSNDVLTIWALEHCGVAQKSLWEVVDAIAANKLVRLLPDFEPEPIDFFAVSLFRSGESAKVDAFVSFLRDAFKKDPLI